MVYVCFLFKMEKTRYAAFVHRVCVVPYSWGSNSPAGVMAGNGSGRRTSASPPPSHSRDAPSGGRGEGDYNRRDMHDWKRELGAHRDAPAASSVAPRSVA